MSAPVSVIIPTLNAAAEIGPCLGALGAALLEGVIREVIFADGGSDDAIADVAEETGARLVTAPRGRGSQLAAGATAAKGEWYLFLHADTVLSEGWASAVAAHMARGRDRAGYFRLAFRSDAAMAELVAGWANLRARLLGLPYGDQGLLIHRALYAEVEGYPEIPLMEDVAIARRLRGRLRGIDAVASTSAARYERRGWIRQGTRNLTTLALYLGGTAPARLDERYRR
ncbi:MAG: TIGR04283 family arsenosugar biosynthesis glycosyltransferase [Pseudomonadota bacterium]